MSRRVAPRDLGPSGIFDFAGQRVQEHVEPNPEGMQFSLIATRKGGAAVFTWLERNQACERFLGSLDRISDDHLPSAILRFAFEYFENTFFKPSWWENLTSGERTHLHRLQACPTLWLLLLPFAEPFRICHNRAHPLVQW